jgi:exodeoxyribonuclease VII large subunit
MPQTFGDKKVFSLFEVCSSIKKTLDERYTSRFWVRAELMKLNYYKYSGHSYPDLVQKDDGRVVAQLRAIIWKSDLLRIQSAFLQVLNEPLKDGLEILFEASITFDAVHGLSLRIHQIDTSFSLGMIEREKLETIAKLKSRGVFELNKNRSFRDLPKNVAVISVETSKGWSDFQKVVEPYTTKYGLFFMLFPALLQGDEAVASIRQQLRKILSVHTSFDMVMIIRGGGGEAGLSCYNNYNLCSDIATYPLPVLTGIGHSTNLTVAEMVAFHHAITPTALAEYYLDIFHKRESELKSVGHAIVKQVTFALKIHKTQIKNILIKTTSSFPRKITYQQFKISSLIHTYQSNIFRIIKAQHGRLDFEIVTLIKSGQSQLKKYNRELSTIEKIIQIQNPENILKKGYAYITANKRTIRSIKQLKANQEIIITMKDGIVNADVLKIQTKKDE